MAQSWHRRPICSTETFLPTSNHNASSDIIFMVRNLKLEKPRGRRKTCQISANVWTAKTRPLRGWFEIPCHLSGSAGLGSPIVPYPTAVCFLCIAPLSRYTPIGPYRALKTRGPAIAPDPSHWQPSLPQSHPFFRILIAFSVFASKWPAKGAFQSPD